jgi:hypothetical protein
MLRDVIDRVWAPLDRTATVTGIFYIYKNFKFGEENTTQMFLD